MRTVFATLLLASALLQDGPEIERRVRQLVEQVRSDDMVEADEAVLALVKLGPAALPAIRQAIEKAEGDLRLRLEGAATQIERNVRRERAMGAPVLVTLKAQDRPLADVLEELRKASGQPLHVKAPPADAITVSFERAPFWETLDGICRKHGGIMWRVNGARIIVERKRYRDRPRVFHGNLVITLDRMTATQQSQQGNSWSYMSLEGTVAWTAGTRPQQVQLGLDALEDDKGTNLASQDPDSSWYRSDDGRVGAESLQSWISFRNQVVPDETAECLKRCKGHVKIVYVLGTRKILSIARPSEDRAAKHASDALTVTVQEFTTSGTEVSARVHVGFRGQPHDLAVKPADFSVTDTEGRAHPARGNVESWTTHHDVSGASCTAEFVLHVTLPENAKVASLDLTAATDVEEVLVPFDFPGLPLK